MTAPLLEMEPLSADTPVPPTWDEVSDVGARLERRNLGAHPSWGRRTRHSAIELTVSPSDPTPEPQRALKPARKIKIKRERAVAKLRIAGEVFLVEVAARSVLIRHPTWSLMGTGRTFHEAERAFRTEARELADVLREAPTTDLDHETVRLLQFVLRVA